MKLSEITYKKSKYNMVGCRVCSNNMWYEYFNDKNFVLVCTKCGHVAKVNKCSVRVKPDSQKSAKVKK